LLYFDDTALKLKSINSAKSASLSPLRTSVFNQHLQYLVLWIKDEIKCSYSATYVCALKKQLSSSIANENN